jgi:DNA-directed RNA polymerase subunit omega
MIIKPRVDKLLESVDSHYAAVVVSAKRARQINAYYHSLSEGAYGEHTPPMIDIETGNYLTIALEETAAGKINYEYKV